MYCKLIESVARIASHKPETPCITNHRKQNSQCPPPHRLCTLRHQKKPHVRRRLLFHTQRSRLCAASAHKAGGDATAGYNGNNVVCECSAEDGSVQSYTSPQTFFQPEVVFLDPASASRPVFLFSRRGVGERSKSATADCEREMEILNLTLDNQGVSFPTPMLSLRK